MWRCPRFLDIFKLFQIQIIYRKSPRNPYPVFGFFFFFLQYLAFLQSFIIKVDLSVYTKSWNTPLVYFPCYGGPLVFVQALVVQY